MPRKAFGDVARVNVLPLCDFCHIDRLDVSAEYDAVTVYGSWANMCVKHFKHMARTQDLGLGKGQKLQLIFIENKCTFCVEENCKGCDVNWYYD